MIATLLRDLQQPEYIHVLINPLPVYGLAGGLIGLFIAICQRSRRAIVAALVIVLVSAAAAWPVYEYGERSYDRVLTMADNDGRAWLAEHKERAEHLIWLFYALAVILPTQEGGFGIANSAPNRRRSNCLTKLLVGPHRLLHPAAALPVPQRRLPFKRSRIRRRLLKSKKAKRFSGRITI